MDLSDFRGTFKLLILNLLRTEPLHGYALMNTLQEMLGGHKPSPGMIYPKLASLKQTGYIEITGREKRDKKIYTITQKGIDYLEHHTEKLHEILKKIKVFNEFLELGGREFGDTIHSIMNTFDELSNEQKKKLSDIMRTSAKKIRYILEFGE
jgi:DNA-binding PadR family transcriptional regulator